MNIRITGGRVIDPSQQLDQVTDLFIADGLIAGIDTAPAGFEAGHTLDASGQVVCPGLVDLCAHVREPGYTHKGSIARESAAAAAGGITTLVTPPTTSPIVDTPAVAQLIQDKARETGLARVLPMGALTRGLEGEQLSPMHALAGSGCIAFSNARLPIRSSLVLMRCLEYAATHDLLVLFQAQDAELAKGCMHDDSTSTRLGLAGIPEAAETVEVARCLMLVEQTGVRAHFGQISCDRSARMIIEARARGLNVSADVAVHHLLLSDVNVDGFDSNYHVIPPLRSQLDRAGLRQALLADGIQAICSDHQPHDAIAKQAPFAATEPGMSGLETLLPLCLMLVEQDLLEMPQLIAKLSCEPAAILGIDAGTLKPGRAADVCIFDPAARWTPSAAATRSGGGNSPFMGTELRGRVTHTLLAGEQVFKL
ncbi:dihydroorotase-like protein [Marinobacterium nitratireducens]|uniref:Dihydroorotase-like protein n=1 Tax=Marinobacterium nitratireducens TaxID=518897 RepID=A0A917Z8E0_9GAMM|nr:dihydroorotase [Marinobacterium nitratireducens]GGO78097.1 dihydroorotase-like protein [Marinobacterium nitratireducens]